MNPTVCVLGGLGMLGSTVLSALLDAGITARGTARTLARVPPASVDRFTPFDSGTDDLSEAVRGLGPGDYVVNCIGMIKQRIDENLADDRLAAIEANGVLPYRLARAAEVQGFRVIQIATDCVFSGERGNYSELDPHDAHDVYGMSKSLGEVPSGAMLNLRSSIIGRELGSSYSLLEWILSHAEGSVFDGYVDHLWNGVTTDAFARIVIGIITTGNPLAGTTHLVPADSVSKYELARIALEEFGRSGATVRRVETGNPVDRTLTTVNQEANDRLWQDAGYASVPTIRDMLAAAAALGPAITTR